MITPASRWIYAVSFALCAMGFLLPLWPLSVLGIALAALSGRWLAGLCMGVLLDLAWGGPMGLAQFLYLPFSIAALVLALVRHYGSSYFLERGSLDTL